MECTQAEAFEQYIRDLRVVRSISRPSFPEGKAPAAVLEEIQTNALRCNTLMRQNEALLAQFVYDRDPASLTEEDIQGLSAFAGRLFNYANSEDGRGVQGASAAAGSGPQPGRRAHDRQGAVLHGHHPALYERPG